MHSRQAYLGNCRRVVLLAMLGLWCFEPLPESQAIPLEYPLITFDSRQGPGAATAGMSYFDFLVGESLLSVGAKVTSINIDRHTRIPIKNGTLDYQLRQLSGPVVTGNTISIRLCNGCFGTTDLMLSGDIGNGMETLLTAHSFRMNLEGIIGSNIAYAESSYESGLGGRLAEYFSGSRFRITNLFFDLSIPLSETIFHYANLTGDGGCSCVSLSAEVAGVLTVAPIPEPSSLLLLGSGLAGVAAWRLRQRKFTASS